MSSVYLHHLKMRKDQAVDKRFLSHMRGTEAQNAVLKESPMKVYKRGMKSLLFMIPLLLAPILLPAESETELAFVYFESCPSCEEYILAGEISEKITLLPGRGAGYNLALPGGETGFKEFLKRQGLGQDFLSLPILFEGTAFTVGYDEILQRVNELLEADNEVSPQSE
jgi:hypothetical protein